MVMIMFGCIYNLKEWYRLSKRYNFCVNLEEVKIDVLFAFADKTLHLIITKTFVLRLIYF